jgi:DNA polymerase alpha subunit A
VFKSILLYKKKKYAAKMLVNGEEKMEIKGLDMVRRDWAPIVKNVCNELLETILSGESRDTINSKIVETLTNCYNKLEQNLY